MNRPENEFFRALNRIVQPLPTWEQYEAADSEQKKTITRRWYLAYSDISFSEDQRAEAFKLWGQTVNRAQLQAIQAAWDERIPCRRKDADELDRQDAIRDRDWAVDEDYRDNGRGGG